MSGEEPSPRGHSTDANQAPQQAFLSTMPPLHEFSPQILPCCLKTMNRKIRLDDPTVKQKIWIFKETTRKISTTTLLISPSWLG